MRSYHLYVAGLAFMQMEQIFAFMQLEQFLPLYKHSSFCLYINGTILPLCKWSSFLPLCRWGTFCKPYAIFINRVVQHLPLYIQSYICIYTDGVEFAFIWRSFCFYTYGAVFANYLQYYQSYGATFDFKRMRLYLTFTCSNFATYRRDTISFYQCNILPWCKWSRFALTWYNV